MNVHHAPVGVKICGITRPDDARAAVSLGADAVGVVFAESPRRVTGDEARGLIEAARGEASRAGRNVDAFGLFVNERAEVIRELSGVAGLDVVQLHGDESLEFVSRLVGMRLVKAIRVKDATALGEVRSYAESGLLEAILLDSFDERRRGGSGKTFDWRVAVEATRLARVILAGGLNPANVREAVARVRPFMVDVSSGVESAPGVKDRALIAQFVAEARAAAGGGE